MKLPKRGQKGFTLIELLIVVAILGVLAAVVIPNIQRFIGAGTTEAQDTEFATIQASVHSMMVDNEIATLPAPVASATATNNMSLFPDITSSDAVPIGDPGKVRDPDGDEYDYSPGVDVVGYLLYQHDIKADGLGSGLVNYVATQTTASYYTVDATGTITQWEDAAATIQLNP